MNSRIISNKGITMITLAVTIVVMMILSFTVSINVSKYVEIKRKTNFETDITKLKEKIDNYYNKNNTLPIINKYTNTDMLNKNVNDNQNYFVIDISKMEDLNLNYGADLKKIADTTIEINDLLDIYIINEQSHVIYYPKGIETNGIIIYTKENTGNIEISNEEINRIEISGEKTTTVGETIQLTATVIPTFIENTGVTWNSNNEDIATIDENGLVTTKKSGMTTITATSKDNTQIKTDYEITVEFVTYYDNPYIPTGFIHTEGTWNNGYVIKQASTGNEFVWVPCVTEQSKVRSDDSVVTFQKITTGKYNTNNYGLLPTDTSVIEEDSSVVEIRNSVEKYQGFYVARYEAGVPATISSTLTNDINKQTQDGTVKPLSQSGIGVWNFVTRTNAILLSKSMIDTVATGAKSALISGECWDTILQWMVNASDSKTTNVGYDINSTGKGNYTGEILNTGNSTDYMINNIYDMAGNAYEWTTENSKNNNTNYSIFRGGKYGDTGSDYPAAIRGIYNDSELNSIAFRAVLYK